MSTWSQRALLDGALSRLEVMTIYNASGIAKDIFRHLDAFPSLQSIILCNTSIRDSRRHREIAAHYGWKLERSGGEFYGQFVRQSREYTSLLNHAMDLRCYARLTNDYVDWRRSEDVSMKNPALVLTAAVGSTGPFRLVSDLICFERQRPKRVRLPPGKNGQDPSTLPKYAAEKAVDNQISTRKRKRMDGMAADYAQML